MAFPISAAGRGTTGQGFVAGARAVPSSQTTITAPSVGLTFTLMGAPQIIGYGRAILHLVTPFQVSSGGRSDPSIVACRLPSLALVAQCGGQLRGEVPKPTLSATGTVPSVGRMKGGLPSLTLLAVGTTGGLAKVQVNTLCGYVVAAQGGIRAALSMVDSPALNAEGYCGGVATAALTLSDVFRLAAGINSEVYGRADMTLPGLQMAPSGQAWLVGPHLSLYAVGHEVVSASYEAYAINLTTGVVTHYTNYPFDNILRFGSKFYGVAPTGLFEIGGTLDVAVPIDAHIKTFATKLGSDQMKRVPYVYSSGRSDGGIRVGITPDEGDTYEYESDWGEQPGNTNHRTQIGKGVRGVYYSFDISNIDGSSLELDSITAEPAVSQRGI